MMLAGRLLLASAGVVLADWAQLGSTMAHDEILASSVTIDSKGPLLAYGFVNNSDAGATTIYWMRYSASGNSWQLVGEHTPQFPQPYDGFSLRTRNGLLYLGLRINEASSGFGYLSSILKTTPPSMAAEGCYAYNSWVFDFDISPSGDARMLFSPDNVTVQMQSYSAAGWAQYPATDTWGPVTQVFNGSAPPGGGNTVTSIVMARGGSGGELYGAFCSYDSVWILSTPAANSTAFSWAQGPTGGPLPLTTVPESEVSLAWIDTSNGAGKGLLCVAAYTFNTMGYTWVEVNCCTTAVAAAIGTCTSRWWNVGTLNSATVMTPGLALQPGAAPSDVTVLVTAMDMSNVSLVQGMAVDVAIQGDGSIIPQSTTQTTIAAPAGLLVNDMQLSGVQAVSTNGDAVFAGSFSAGGAAAASGPVLALSFSSTDGNWQDKDMLAVYGWQ